MSAMSMNEKQFQEMMKEGNTFLVDFWAPWCGYCRRIGPAYDKIAEQYSDRIPIVKVNIDEESALANAQKIEVIPTLILYRDGKAMESVVAPDSKAAIDAFLQENLNR